MDWGGGIGEGEIGEGGFEIKGICLRFQPNVNFTAYLRLHCWTKRSCSTVADFFPKWDFSRIFSVLYSSPFLFFLHPCRSTDLPTPVTSPSFPASILSGGNSFSIFSYPKWSFLFILCTVWTIIFLYLYSNVSLFLYCMTARKWHKCKQRTCVLCIIINPVHML